MGRPDEDGVGVVTGKSGVSCEDGISPERKSYEFVETVRVKKRIMFRVTKSSILMKESTTELTKKETQE